MTQSFETAKELGVPDGSLFDAIRDPFSSCLSVTNQYLEYPQRRGPGSEDFHTFVDALPNHDTAWLTVAMASTLAGNFAILGSIANLIVVEKAASRGVSISFWEYFRVGAPLTVLTIAVGALWLSR